MQHLSRRARSWAPRSNTRQYLRKALPAAIAAVCAGAGTPVFAACTASGTLTLTCSGTLTTPIDLYDVAAGVQPTAGGNSYATGSYSQNPATYVVNLDSSVVFDATATSASGGGLNNDRGLITANYSNNENPAVNNVTVNNAGNLSLTSISLSSGRLHAIVSDSQVNVFTVNNASGASVAASQTYGWGSGGFSAANLSASFSSTALTYTAKYSGTNLAVTTALYSDDNTNQFDVNNAGSLLASGNYSAAYYGRAQAAIVNTGSIVNQSWSAGDAVNAGHWAIVGFGGASFATVAGSNPDTPLYDVTNVSAQSFAGGTHNVGSLALLDTSTLSLQNSGTIKGDILVIDSTPLNLAAAQAQGVSASNLSASGTNSGPMGSDITNSGTIQGNIYLGSGTHLLTNNGSLQGNVSVNQAGGIGAFSMAAAGTGGLPYTSTGTGTDASGAACPTAGTGTTDPLCAQSTTALASFAGARSFTLANAGTFQGNLSIANMTAASKVTLGFLISGSAAGSTLANPYATPSRIQGTLSLSGNASIASTVTIVPTVQTGTQLQSNTWYSLADHYVASGLPSVQDSALVSWTLASNASGALAATPTVASAATLPGISGAGAAALDHLAQYGGSNASVLALAGAVQGITKAADAVALAEQLRPTNRTVVRDAGFTLGGQALDAVGTRALAAAAGLPTPASSSQAAWPAGAQLAMAGDPAGLAGPGDAGLGSAAAPNRALWIDLQGSNLHQGRQGATDGYQGTTSGVLVGLDLPVQLWGEHSRLGVAVSYGYDSTQISSANPGSSVSDGSLGVLAYGAAVVDAWRVDGSVGYFGHDYQTERQIAAAGITDDARASFNGSSLLLQVEAERPFTVSEHIQAGPVLSLRGGTEHLDAYSETSAAGTGLGFAGVSADTVRTGAGVRAHLDFGAQQPALAALDLQLLWLHEFGSQNQNQAVAFAGGDPFQVSQLGLNRDALQLAAGLQLRSRDQRRSLTLAVQAEARGSYHAESATLQFRQML